MTNSVHKEAFCLMWYACKCGHRERVWNSRDGVTPFGMGCPSCGKSTLLHVDWELDVPSPAHQLASGQGFWRDGTPDDAERIMTKRLDGAVGTPYEVDIDMRLELIAIARSDTTGEFGHGWPMFERFANG